jgi:hypothetical protein
MNKDFEFKQLHLQPFANGLATGGFGWGDRLQELLLRNVLLGDIAGRWALMGFKLMFCLK